MKKSIYFIGIGGIGMSALARYFLALKRGHREGQKWSILGSDLVSSSITSELIKEGVNVKIGHKKAYINKETELVIYNRAIRDDNPELIAARKLKIPTLPYAKILGRITEAYATIAVTGSHGKSTTTAIIGSMLMKGGLDPTILVGTKLIELEGSNMRLGSGPYLVLEADDFGAAFLDYSPVISIVTNIDKEHMDFYKNFSNVKNAFLKFLARTKNGGLLILNRDDVPLFSLKGRITKIAKKKNLDIVWYSLKDPETKKIKSVIDIPGQHNVSNALAAFKLGKYLMVPEKKMLAAIGAYHGAWRRMEYKGELKIKNSAIKVRIYDDYAHHPTEITATLRGFKEKFPKSPLFCVFQPHQAKRLEALFEEFKGAFDVADIVLILPLYRVAGRDEAFAHDSAALVRAMQKRSPKKLIFYLENPKNLKAAVTTLLTADPRLCGGSRFVPSRSPVLVMMGAGDIADLTAGLFKKD